MPPLVEAYAYTHSQDSLSHTHIKPSLSVSAVFFWQFHFSLDNLANDKTAHVEAGGGGEAISVF